LKAKQFVTRALAVAETSCSAPNDEWSGENRERYPRIFAFDRGAARCDQVHAHTSVGTDVSQRASMANVAALNDPDLANRRADVGCELIGSQVEDAVEPRASTDFVKNSGYSVFFGRRH
jgi:hypothetical protein